MTVTSTNVSLLKNQGYGPRKYLAGGYTALLISASALSSWNVPFSSSRVRFIWKVVSIGSAVSPIATLFTYWQGDLLFDSDSGRFANWKYANVSNSLLKIIFYMFFVLHIVFRVLLIGFIFLSFQNLPPEIYETQSWLAFLPSIH